MDHRNYFHRLKGLSEEVADQRLFVSEIALTGGEKALRSLERNAAELLALTQRRRTLAKWIRDESVRTEISGLKAWSYPRQRIGRSHRRLALRFSRRQDEEACEDDREYDVFLGETEVGRVSGYIDVSESEWYAQGTGGTYQTRQKAGEAVYFTRRVRDRQEAERRLLRWWQDTDGALD